MLFLSTSNLESKFLESYSTYRGEVIIIKGDLFLPEKDKEPSFQPEPIPEPEPEPAPPPEPIPHPEPEIEHDKKPKKIE